MEMHPYLSFDGQCEAAFAFDARHLGGDVAPDRYEAPRGFSLSLQPASAAEAERVFHELAAGGRVVVPLEKTFWAERFGMVVDRFGIPWLINCEAAAEGAS